METTRNLWRWGGCIIISQVLDCTNISEVLSLVFTQLCYRAELGGALPTQCRSIRRRSSLLTSSFSDPSICISVRTFHFIFILRLSLLLLFPRRYTEEVSRLASGEGFSVLMMAGWKHPPKQALNQITTSISEMTSVGWHIHVHSDSCVADMCAKQILLSRSTVFPVDARSEHP